MLNAVGHQLSGVNSMLNFIRALRAHLDAFTIGILIASACLYMLNSPASCSYEQSDC
jgi:hypothetical protein